MVFEEVYASLVCHSSRFLGSKSYLRPVSLYGLRHLMDVIPRYLVGYFTTIIVKLLYEDLRQDLDKKNLGMSLLCVVKSPQSHCLCLSRVLSQ